MSRQQGNDELDKSSNFSDSTSSGHYVPQRMRTIEPDDEDTNADEQNDESQDSEGSFWKSILEFLTVIVSALFIAYALRFFVFELYVVPTGSMLQTIQEQDMLVGEKVSLYFDDPKVGNIITFKDPIDPNKILIKRMIADEGSTIDLIDGAVYVDGKKLSEPYVSGQRTDPESKASNLGLPISYPYTVPEGCIWVMGDNRGNSLDSRAFGPVKKSAITSRAVWIVWPLEDVTML